MEAIQYFETRSTDPAYNLAFEEHILTHFRQGNLLILWQNDNAVIIGRNQNTAEEINQQFVNDHGIRVIRRNTGGGAVYHDLGNLNYSFIADAEGIDQAATQLFLSPVVNALKTLGLDARFSGRNDILVSDRKISGTAQQLCKGRLLLHGTLLFDSDPDMISGALNPDPTKFQSKSVKSVRSRVGNIRQFLKEDMDIRSFWHYLKTQLAGSSIIRPVLSDADLAAVQKLKQDKYDTWDWNYGRSPKFEIQNKKRWPGGLLDIRMTVSGGKITLIKIYGDFLALESIEPLEQALTGCAFHKDALTESLASICLPQYIGAITKDELIQTLLGDN